MGTTIGSHKFKLYLEGEAVDFSNAEVTFGRNGSGCNIDLPASGAMAKVWPRTLVHILFKRNIDKEWKVLFFGEVHSVSFSKSSRGSSMRLSCRDFSAYFDQLYRYYMRNASVFYAGQKVKRFFAADVTAETGFIGTNPSNESSNDSNVVDKAKSIRYIISDIKDFVSSILQPMCKTNPYTEKLLDTYKLDDIMRCEKDEYINLTFKDKAVKNLFQNTTPSSMETVRELISKVTNLIYYAYSSMSPTYNNNSIGATIFYPESPMLPPPKCNIIYPHMAQMVSMSEGLTSKPTRMMLGSENYLTKNADSFFSYMAVAPGELSQWSSKQYLHGDVTSKEMITGMMPSVKNISMVTKLIGMKKVMDSDESNRNKCIDILGQIAQYELVKTQLMTSNGGASGMPFNPNLVAGLTCAIISPPIIIRGVINSVTHSISKNSYATNISLSSCFSSQITDTSGLSDEYVKNTLDWNSNAMTQKVKDLLEMKEEYQSLFPAFINKVFTPSTGGYGYINLIGSECSSAFFDNPAHSTMIDAIRGLYSEYKAKESSGEEISYAEKVTERPIATEKQFFEYFGQTINSNGTFEKGTYFNDTRKSVIIKHNTEVNGGQ